MPSMRPSKRITTLALFAIWRKGMSSLSAPTSGSCSAPPCTSTLFTPRSCERRLASRRSFASSSPPPSTYASPENAAGGGGGGSTSRGSMRGSMRGSTRGCFFTGGGAMVSVICEGGGAAVVVVTGGGVWVVVVMGTDGSLVVVTTFTDASAILAAGTGACVVVATGDGSVWVAAGFAAIIDFTFGQSSSPPPAIAANAISTTNSTTQIGFTPCSIR